MSAISSAGTGYQIPMTIWANPITFDKRALSDAANAKIAIVNGQRYILTSVWTPTSPITIWAADLAWNRLEKVSTSSSVGGIANDFYAYTFDSLPDTIVMVGTNNSLNSLTKPSAGFIAAYNVTSGAWIWKNVPSVVWITNVLNVGGNFYIVPAGNTNYLWFCRIDTLFNPSYWIKINTPLFGRVTVENRFAYYNGEMFMLRSNHALYWELYKWDFGSNWTLLANNRDTSRKDDAIPLIFPSITATEHGVAYTVPYANQTWSIYCSPNGTTFSQLANVPMIGGFLESFSGSGKKEIQCWAYPYSDNRIAVLNTKLSNPSGYAAVYDASGNELRRGIGYVSHYTEANFLRDGNYLVAGGEHADGSPFADLKVVNLNDPKALSTNHDSKGDFSDLRFTDGEGIPLAFWIQHYVANISVEVWVKVNEDLNSQQKIFMYFGNPSATSASNIESTFVLGEDFRTQKSINMEKWQLSGSPIISFSAESGMSLSKPHSSAYIVSASKYNFSENLRIIQMQRLTAQNNQTSSLFITPNKAAYNLSSNSDFVQFTASPLSYRLKYKVNNASTFAATQKKYLPNSWLYTEIETNGASYLRAETNGSQNYLNNDGYLNMTQNYIALQVSTENANGVSADWQYIFATKYVNEEIVTVTASSVEAQAFNIVAIAESNSQIGLSGAVAIVIIIALFVCAIVSIFLIIYQQKHSKKAMTFAVLNSL